MDELVLLKMCSISISKICKSSAKERIPGERLFLDQTTKNNVFYVDFTVC